ncbi:16488_t:CDS:2, partial [Racocetra fulgida]
MATSSQDLYDIDTDTINYINVLDSTYLDPDQEYKLLDNESGCSFTDHSCEIPGTPHTDSSENDYLYSDTFSNKEIYELALNYFRTLSNNDEIYRDIDWLSSDLDKSTDTESSCSFSLLTKENETDYEIKDYKRSNNSNSNIKQCVISEIKDVNQPNAQALKFNPPSYMATKIAMQLKKIQLSSLFETENYIKIIREQPKKLGEALGLEIRTRKSHELIEMRHQDLVKGKSISLESNVQDSTITIDDDNNKESSINNLSFVNKKRRYDQFYKTNNIIIPDLEHEQQTYSLNNLSNKQKDPQRFDNELTLDNSNFEDYSPFHNNKDIQTKAFMTSNSVNLNDNLNFKNLLIHRSTNNFWILLLIFKYQERFWLSDVMIESLLKICKLVLIDADIRQFENFSSTIYMTNKLLEIRKNNKINKIFAACPDCNKLYNISTSNSGFKCTYIEFPSHPLQTQRQPCGSEVLVKVPVKQELLQIIMQNWRLDDLISTQSNNLNLIKGLSLIWPKATVGSLAIYDNCKFDELCLFRQIYQLEIEDTITAYYNNAYDMEFLSIEEFTGEKARSFERRIVIRPQAQLSLELDNPGHGQN